MGRFTEMFQNRVEPILPPFMSPQESLHKLITQLYDPIFQAFAARMDEFENEVKYLRTVKVARPDVANLIVHLWENKETWAYGEFKAQMDDAIGQLKKAIE